MSKPRTLVDLLPYWREDPLTFARALWPRVEFFDKQREIIYSVRDDQETFVHAGNMLSKDFTAGFIALWYFICHDVVRVVTTSVKEDHLRVLWDEINNFLSASAIPLRDEQGGPLRVNHLDIRKVSGCSQEGKEKSYLWGTVSKKGEGLSGHHAPDALLIVDEASGADEEVYERGSGWAKRKLIIGNPFPCQNFFYKGCKGGTITA